MDTREKVRIFIVENFLFGDERQPVGHDESLYERGIVDSTGVLNIISFIEDEFGLRVADDEILPENFDSIAKIASFIDSKRVPGARA